MTLDEFSRFDRLQVETYLRDLFPELDATDRALSQRYGGRSAAVAHLVAVKPGSYERSRNFLDGDVTRLSAYLRHGVVTLAETRDSALDAVADPREAGKLINEYAWRDYWQRLYEEMGEGVWEDREAWKTGFDASHYAEQLPSEIPSGETTLTCIDGFAEELADTGYLHNHARMWTAAYVVHWRGIRWQAGARWFLEHLLDGDPASNNLSWQWVASTFASKPYIFNRENLERYTKGLYCRQCPHASTGTCPFEQEYEALEQTLFPQLHQRRESSTTAAPPRPFERTKPRTTAVPIPEGKPLLWVHTDALNPASPMLLEHASSPGIFVWDRQWVRDEMVRLKRLVFLSECLMEMPGRFEMRAGDVAAEVIVAAQARGAAYVLAQRTPDPRLLAAAARVATRMPVIWYDPPAFVNSERAFDLKRFSRYWQKAQHAAMLPTRPA